MDRGIHADPDTAHLFQLLVVGIAKLTPKLRGEHPRRIEDSTGDQAVFPVKIFLRFQVDEKAEGFVCNEKLLDSFDENVTSECYAMHKDVNHIPFLFTEIRKIGRFILLVAEYHRFVP